MKRAGLIALLLLLGLSLQASAATSKNPLNRKARAHARELALKQRASKPSSAPLRLAKKTDSDPTPTWQPYSYP